MSIPGFPPAPRSIVLTAMCVMPLANLAGGESIQDQKAARALSQRPPDWGQALSYLLQAHGQDRTHAERYRKIAMCLQNTNRPLAAMAWYQTYRAAPGVDPQKAEAAGVQLELLEVDVRSKMGGLFTEAVNIAEKQIKEKVALNGIKYTTTHNLLLLPVLQAEAGMPVEAQATQRRVAALNVRPENYGQAVDLRLRYSYRHSDLSPQERYLHAAALVGDAATVQSELAKLPAGVSPGEERERSITGFTRHEQWSHLAELVRFNLSQERNYRLAWAEQITRTDPMGDLDARTGVILRQEDSGGIPLALGSLAEDVGQTLLKVRAMRPENAKPELSEATRKVALRRVGELCSMGGLGSGAEYNRLVVRAVSRFDATPLSFTDPKGMPWTGIAWALKQLTERGTGVSAETIALLTENGMGVNDPIATTLKEARGNTSLHWAVQWNNLQAVELLLAHHANPALKNGQGRTALDLALTPYRNVGSQIAVGNEIAKRLRQALTGR